MNDYWPIHDIRARRQRKDKDNLVAGRDYRNDVDTLLAAVDDREREIQELLSGVEAAAVNATIAPDKRKAG